MPFVSDEAREEYRKKRKAPAKTPRKDAVAMVEDHCHTVLSNIERAVNAQRSERKSVKSVEVLFLDTKPMHKDGISAAEKFLLRHIKEKQPETVQVRIKRCRWYSNPGNGTKKHLVRVTFSPPLT